MSVLPNENCVFGATFNGSNSHIGYHGKTASAQACSDACAVDVSCVAYTWHDDQQPRGSQKWESMCYFVLSGTTLSCHAQTHHISGVDHHAQHGIITIINRAIYMSPPLIQRLAVWFGAGRVTGGLAGLQVG